MVAEEVVEVYPKMVSFKRGERTVTTTNELGEEITEVEYFETDIPETVNYGSPHFITALLQQVQELFAKVQMAFSWNQDNEDRIELLEDENEALKARLDKLELNNELAK